MAINKFWLIVFFILLNTHAVLADGKYFDISADACETIMNGESKSSTRLRASDKATFMAVKKLDQLKAIDENLSDHDFNVLVYRFVDEYIEDLSVSTTADEENKVCVSVNGKISADNVNSVKAEFEKNKKEPQTDEVQEIQKIVEDVNNDLRVKPENPESLALVHVKQLEYFNGSKSVKYANLLKKHIDNNPYFYLTDDAEIADYVITPKVLKVAVDALDAGNNRLHMALVLEIAGIEKEIVSEYQNRFVLFGAEEDKQQIASRLISKLIEQAGDGLIRKIEHKEQQKIENKLLGR